MTKDDLSKNKTMVSRAFARLSEAVGVHVMVLVGEYALWRAKHKFGDAALVTVSEEGFALDGLDSLPMERAQEIMDELLLAIVDTLGRLVGVQMAKELADQLRIRAEEGGVE